jgi:hypothetical protein
MKVARKYESGVQLHQAYIDILLRLAGHRLSDLYTSILAHSSYYGTINKEIKDSVALQNQTSTQVISNAITRLRKLGLLEKNVINKKLSPISRDDASITLFLGLKDVTTSVPEPSTPESNITSHVKLSAAQ